MQVRTIELESLVQLVEEVRMSDFELLMERIKIHPTEQSLQELARYFPWTIDFKFNNIFESIGWMSQEDVRLIAKRALQTIQIWNVELRHPKMEIFKTPVTPCPSEDLREQLEWLKKNFKDCRDIIYPPSQDRILWGVYISLFTPIVAGMHAVVLRPRGSDNLPFSQWPVVTHWNDTFKYYGLVFTLGLMLFFSSPNYCSSRYRKKTMFGRDIREVALDINSKCDKWIDLLDKLIRTTPNKVRGLEMNQEIKPSLREKITSMTPINHSQKDPQKAKVVECSVDFILNRFKNLKKLSEGVAVEIIKIGETQINAWKDQYKKFHFPTLQPAPSSASGNLKEQLKWITDTFNKLEDFFSHPDKQSQWYFLCFKKKSVDAEEGSQIKEICKKWLAVCQKLLDLIAANKIKKKSTDGRHKSRKRKQTSIQVKTHPKNAVTQIPNTTSTFLCSSESGKPKISVAGNQVNAAQTETKLLSPVKPLQIGTEDGSQQKPVKSVLHQVDPRSQPFSGQRFTTCMAYNGVWQYVTFGRDPSGVLHNLTYPDQKGPLSPNEKIINSENKETIPAQGTQDVSQLPVSSAPEIIKTVPIVLPAKDSESVKVEPVLNPEAPSTLPVVKQAPLLLIGQTKPVDLDSKIAVISADQPNKDTNISVGQVPNAIAQSTSARPELTVIKSETSAANSTFSLFSDLTTHILSDYNGEQNGVEEDLQTPVLEVNESDSEPDSDSEWSYVFQTKKSR